MNKLTAVLDHLPVATLVHLLVAVVGAVDLLIDGHLSTDFLTYMAIIEGGNGLVALGRGQAAKNRPAPAVKRVH